MRLSDQEELFFTLSGYMDKDEAIKLTTKVATTSMKYALSHLEAFQKSIMTQGSFKIHTDSVASMLNIRIGDIKNELIKNL